MATPINVAAFAKPAAPAATKSEDWTTLDVETFSDDLQALYYSYRKAQDAANTQRKAFEAAMSAKLELPSHLTLAFGYRFGKLSVAIVPKAKPSASRSALSLADLMRRVP
jgi:hypothetical protein